MRLLHIVHQYPPDFRGGTEYYTQMLAAAQAETGHMTAVFAPAPVAGPPNLSDQVENGVQVYRAAVGQRSRTQVFWQSFRQPGLRATFNDVLELAQPELVHIQHLMGLPFDLIDDLEAAALPFVVTLHDYWYQCANAQLITNTDGSLCAGPDASGVNCASCALARGGYGSLDWTAPAVAPLLRRRNTLAASVLARAARIIAPTRFVFETYRPFGLPLEKTVVVPHGIDLPLDAIAAARHLRATRAADGRLHIGYVGSVGELKGLHVLIDAVNRLPADKVTLTIYGGLEAFPAYVTGLKQQAQHPGITFAGAVNRDMLWQAMADFDVVVLPTLWYEVSPLVIDEVFAMGIPIVAADIGAMQEKVNDGIDGRRFPPGDAAALADILADLLRDPSQLRRWEQGIPPVQVVSQHMKAIEEVYAQALDSV